MTTTSFDDLYRLCAPSIARHVGQMMRRYPYDAADVCQFTWMKVFCALPDAHEPSYQWVRRIATNTALDVLRAAKRHQEIAPQVSLDRVPEGDYDDERRWDEILAGAPDVSEGAISDEFTRAVLAGITPANRRALLLRCAGYSYQEIGAREHLAGSSAKNTIQHARQQARRAARDYEEARAS